METSYNNSNEFNDSWINMCNNLLGNKRTTCDSELFQFHIDFKTKVVSGMTVTQIDRSQLDLDYVYRKVKVTFCKIATE